MALERTELKANNKGERKELSAIYVARGLDPALVKQVAEQLMAQNALGAHARDELGMASSYESLIRIDRLGILACCICNEEARRTSFPIMFAKVVPPRVSNSV